MIEVVTVREAVLQTLAPALARLEERVRGWLQAPRRRPLPPTAEGELAGMADDLGRQAASLGSDRPLLVILLMGGTGVGKSSLLNALARGPVAQASYVRPTTRDPVVYYHQSIALDRLDPTLRNCRLVAHDRAPLEQKILVDTPDLDSNEVANRETLERLLPLADVVLYVGSQEKYHDLVGWELFLRQRQRRAFAFVLNKWDRCLHGLTSGLRPDEDLLSDLQAEGFANPLIFRTCARAWAEANGKQPEGLPEGEDFPALESWLEQGLTRMEIEAIKARGTAQLLARLRATLEATKPPSLFEAAQQTKVQWEHTLTSEAQAVADILLATIDPFHRQIERHFAVEGHRRFRGVMSTFLRWATRIRFLGGSMSQYLPKNFRAQAGTATSDAGWDLAALSQACTGLASDKHLDARGQALPNRLLVEADQEGVPVALLSPMVEAAERGDWRQRVATTMTEVLHQVEAEWTKPTGTRNWVQQTFIWVGDWLPLVALLLSSGFLLYDYFLAPVRRTFAWTDVFLPLAAVFFSMLIMYVVINVALPTRWPAIRGAFHRRVRNRLREELLATYLHLPEQLARELAVERQAVDDLIQEVEKTALWLESRESGGAVTSLYGSAQGSTPGR
jgi:hypothetical protein